MYYPVLKCFMAIFTAECIIKIMALQNQYFRSGWNIFDMIIVIISYVDLALSDNTNGSRGLSVIRSMRLVSRSVIAELKDNKTENCYT